MIYLIHAYKCTQPSPRSSLQSFFVSSTDKILEEQSSFDCEEPGIKLHCLVGTLEDEELVSGRAPNWDAELRCGVFCNDRVKRLRPNLAGNIIPADLAVELVIV